MALVLCVGHRLISKAIQNKETAPTGGGYGPNNPI